jgi:hypothetical protein
VNKRHRARTPIANTAVKISDGERIFQGSIGNVSYTGLLVSDIPAGFARRGRALDLTITAQGQVYEVRALPRWERGSGPSMVLGLRLFSVPRGWYAFVDRAALPEIGMPVSAQEEERAVRWR